MQNETATPRPGECPQCKWINGHRSWCSEFTLMSEDGRVAFLERLRDFTHAGNMLIDVWADADEVAPLPDRLKPPISLDEWLIELTAFYEVALAEITTVPDDDVITCPKCGCANTPGGHAAGCQDGQPRWGNVPATESLEAAEVAAGQPYLTDPDAERKETMAANEVAHKVHPTVLVPDEDLTDWVAAWANIETLPFPVFDGTGCRWIDLGSQVYGLMDWDGEYRIGLYYNTEDGADEGVCARFDDWADAEAFALRLCAAGVEKKGA